MSTDEIAIIDSLTWLAFAASWILLLISSASLRSTKKHLKEIGLLEADILNLITEMKKDRAKIWAYNALKHCAFDLDECTVTIVFNNVQEIKEFLDTHDPKSRIKK